MPAKRILLIEDEPDLSRTMTIRLEASGYHVDNAGDGEEGYVKIKHTDPDLILLDLMLPKMDGIEVLKLAKTDSNTRKIPVIVLTAYGTKDIIKECRDRGANEVIVKPCNTPDLLRLIEVLIDERESEDSLS